MLAKRVDGWGAVELVVLDVGIQMVVQIREKEKSGFAILDMAEMKDMKFRRQGGLLVGRH